MNEAAHKLESVESPCIDICRLDDSGLCVGCFRTGNEIAGWLGYSAEQRQEIMARLPLRAGQMFSSEG
ncbi:MAG: DUF1289 domain-containing protein [Wenzhouxiangellaceae bacterium]